VIVVTGRMFQSVRRYLDAGAIDDPVVCYQGALIADPVTGAWLRHIPIPLPAAHEALDAVIEAGFHINAYVDDELYVGAATPEAHAYADLNKVEMHVVGDLRAWLSEPPTKLVVIDDPVVLDELEERMKTRFDGRMYISKSLPYFLEFAAPGVTKAAGLDFLSTRLGFTPDRTIAFGDGENDIELVAWAGYGVAVDNAHNRVKAIADFVCPSVDEEGVAQVLEAYLDSRA
jgi:Cof subfamily protein (haloacid dehalogenase superfamily)